MATYKKNRWFPGELITADKMNAIEEQLDIIAAIANNIANAYDENTEYSSADYCIYNDKMYKALKDTTGHSPLDSDWWIKTDIGAEIKEMGAYEMALKHGYDGSFEQFMLSLGQGATYATSALTAAERAEVAAASITQTTSDDLNWILGGDDSGDEL